MTGFSAALSFLTRVRIGEAPASHERPGAAIPWFSVVGAMVGLVVAGAYALCGLLLPPLVAATVAISVGILLTGALHEDGLADSADALGAWTREDALAILDDPRTGAFGVLAVVVSTLLRVGALASLGSATAVAMLAAAHALSRAAALAVLGLVPPARAVGLGAAYGRGASRAGIVTAVAVALAVSVAALGPWALPAAALVTLVAAGVGRLARRRFGGTTGDILGAVQQCTEIAVALFVVALVRYSQVPPPWWR